MIQTPELRASGIGGSDIAAIAGLSKWQTPYDIYLQKTNPPPEENKDEFYWGRMLEAVIANEYARRTNKKVRQSNKTYRAKNAEFLMAHVDRLIQGENKLLECKTSRYGSDDEWGESGTDKIPLYYMMQVQHYLEVLEFEFADLAVLIGGNEFRIYNITRDKKIGAIIRQLASEFWERVQKRNPPPITTMSDFNKKYKFDNGTSVIASPEIKDTVIRLKEIKFTIKSLEDEEETLKTVVGEFMGNAAYLLDESSNEIASLKSMTTNRVNADFLKESHPEIYQASLLENKYRKFVIKKEKKNK